MTRKRWDLEVRLNDDETLDEVVCDGAFVHLEQMDTNLWWLVVTKGKKSVNVWLQSKSTIHANCEDAEA
jgi:hypothetical protein